MAARKRNYQTDKTREKIKTTQLVNRLQGFVMGDVDTNGKPIELSPAQIKGIDILLSKTLPALTQADVTQHNVPEERTYEELKAELIRTRGEPMALLMLNEIGPAEYMRMIEALSIKTDNSVPNKVETVSKDAPRSPTLSLESTNTKPDPGTTIQ